MVISKYMEMCQPIGPSVALPSWHQHSGEHADRQVCPSCGAEFFRALGFAVVIDKSLPPNVIEFRSGDGRKWSVSGLDFRSMMEAVGPTLERERERGDG